MKCQQRQTIKKTIMLQSTIIDRLHRLQIAFELNTDLGHTTRAEMNQSAIDRLSLLLK